MTPQMHSLIFTAHVFIAVSAAATYLIVSVAVTVCEC